MTTAHEPGPDIHSKIRKSASETTHVSSPPADQLTAWHVRDFVRGLDRAGIPDTAEISSRTNNSTMRTVGLETIHSVKINRLASDEPA